MPLAQSKNRVGLGHAIINRKAKEAKMKNSSEFHTTDINNYGSTSNLRSVTHEGDLEEFLNTAQLADADFTAERRNVTIVSAPGLTRSDRHRHNPYLLSGEEENEVLRKHGENKERLRVPRRPAWTSGTTRSQLERAEKDSFLEWRRGLAQLQEGVGLVLTPFERNIEVWRQLWRVVERSHLVVQIVDARNPLRFRCEDLENYVSSLGLATPQGQGYRQLKQGEQGYRRNLLLINKADLLDQNQRRQWADYFESQGIQYAFFSALDAAALQAAQAEEEQRIADEREERERRRREKAENPDDEEEEGEEEEDGEEEEERVQQGDDETLAEATAESVRISSETDAVSAAMANAVANLGGGQGSKRDMTRVLNVLELEELFMASAPPLESFKVEGSPPSKLIVGLVGYPNVGKSSTINALLGAKKVSVSSTPGKTKHFQTIHFSPTTLLCDCPGLVFPQFATSSADLVCDGVLPIDQMREYTGPAELVAKRIPKDIIEATYGFRIQTLAEEEGGTGQPTGLEILTAYALARGYTRQGQGGPDETRSVRYILKDYVNAKLLYAHPPPGVDADLFNEEQRNRARESLKGRRYDPTKEEGEEEDGRSSTTTKTASKPGGAKSSALDRDFFDSSNDSKPKIMGRKGIASDRLRGRVNDDGTVNASVGGMKESLSSSGGGKKHNKANKRKKNRSGAGFD
ncbi:P-loop containing nucleoside triphosphate hydrolase protein [Violaceomyces palustris]|uniref:P-loop containing nucleoside triphosphate hydrolase protein n=1 Tax=Violaceomyces palustris TaxID=1673888 RepID=A0ACD0P8T8_9BASI|nr:P-loop containing nucleoside triphosphate hydrolase protein [Violaceomyces palustris]